MNGHLSMAKCKHCKNKIQIALNGLRGFCSEDCKKAHRKAYMAELMRNKRAVSKKGGYTNISSQDVSKTNPCQKPICEGKKQGHGLSEDNFESYGGKKWYEFAKKHCCNFDVREREGYCVTLLSPVTTFVSTCNQCGLGMALKACIRLNP